MSTLLERARRTLPPRMRTLPEPPALLRGMPMALLARLTPSILVEEYMSEDRFVVRAELAGADPGKDVEVQVGAGLLTITEQRGFPDVAPYRSEFRRGTLTRTIPLPRRAVEDDVTAHFGNGVLEVSVPLSERATTHTVKIVRDDGSPAAVAVRKWG